MKWTAQMHNTAEGKNFRVSSLRNRLLTDAQLAASMNSTHQTPVSSATLKRRLGGAGLLRRVSKIKPHLKLANVKKRVEWGK